MMIIKIIGIIIGFYILFIYLNRKFRWGHPWSYRENWNKQGTGMLSDYEDRGWYKKYKESNMFGKLWMLMKLK